MRHRSRSPKKGSTSPPPRPRPRPRPRPQPQQPPSPRGATNSPSLLASCRRLTLITFVFFTFCTFLTIASGTTAMTASVEGSPLAVGGHVPGHPAPQQQWRGVGVPRAKEATKRSVSSPQIARESAHFHESYEEAETDWGLASEGSTPSMPTATHGRLSDPNYRPPETNPTSNPASAKPPTDSPTDSATPRLVIRQADISLEVTDVSQSVEQLTALAVKHKGYVEAMNVVGENNDVHSQREHSRAARLRADGLPEPTPVPNTPVSGTLTLRIPASRFEEIVQGCRDGAVSVISELISGEDVTSEYVDLTSRTRALRSALTRLETLMDRATKIEEILSIQDRMTTVVTELERYAGRATSLKGNAELSTIRLQLARVCTDCGPSAPAPIFRPFIVFNRALKKVMRVVAHVAESSIVAVVFGAPVAVILIITLLMAQWVVRKTAHGRQEVASRLRSAVVQVSRAVSPSAPPPTTTTTTTATTTTPPADHDV